MRSFLGTKIPSIASAKPTRYAAVSLLASLLAVVLLTGCAQFAVASDETQVIWPPLQVMRCVPRTLAQIEVLPPPITTQHLAAGRTAPLKSKKVDKYDILHIGSRNIGKGFNLYSMSMERELGRELAASLDSQLGEPVDERVSKYISTLAQNLFAHSDSQFLITAKVFESDEVNAFSLPGGYLYVSTGLIVDARDEAELAGVMAHEIAHVAARHATKSESRRQLFGFAALPLSSIGGLATAAISGIISVARPLSTAKFSRSAENEADLLGLQYAYATGYDPLELVHFFERYLKEEPEKKGSIFGRLFADHPMTAERISRCQQQIRKQLPQKEQYVITTYAFDETKSILINAYQLTRAASTGGPTLHRQNK